VSVTGDGREGAQVTSLHVALDCVATILGSGHVAAVRAWAGAVKYLGEDVGMTEFPWTVSEAKLVAIKAVVDRALGTIGPETRGGVVVETWQVLDTAAERVGWAQTKVWAAREGYPEMEDMGDEYWDEYEAAWERKSDVEIAALLAKWDRAHGGGG
jgi:hypothetical protein